MKTYNFDVEKNVQNCIQWIKEWFEKNGKGCNAIIGLSGGKDSTIVAALCAKALGAERVVGVAMPDRGQDINDADKIAEYLGIKFLVLPIGDICSGFDTASDSYIDWSVQTQQNIPPRIRMTMLYAVAQTYNGRVANTCNLSENYVGYATLFGDSAGSFSPLGNMTVTEIYAMGDYLGIPEKWVHKIPDDGLPHSSSDEDKFGFTYAELDMYIREQNKPDGYCSNDKDTLKIDKILSMHNNSRFKEAILNIPTFPYRPC